MFLTALDSEYQAVRGLIADLTTYHHPAGTRFEVGRLATGPRSPATRPGRVALALVGKGNHPAAVLAERAIAEFDPVAVLFVGVAGALRPTISLGDIIVATHLYAYHGATSEDDGDKARPRLWETSHGPIQTARHLSRGERWADRLPPGHPRPKVHFGPIAAGEVVRNSTRSASAKWVRDHYNDALAIEMEGAGVAQAGHLNQATPVIIVRGVSDHADGTKHVSDAARCQPRAAAAAAAFATALAEELIHDVRRARTRRRSRHAPAAAAENARSSGEAMTVRPVASDNAQFGIQAGHTVLDLWRRPVNGAIRRGQLGQRGDLTPPSATACPDGWPGAHRHRQPGHGDHSPE